MPCPTYFSQAQQRTVHAVKLFGSAVSPLLPPPGCGAKNHASAAAAAAASDAALGMLLLLQLLLLPQLLMLLLLLRLFLEPKTTQEEINQPWSPLTPYITNKKPQIE